MTVVNKKLRIPIAVQRFKIYKHVYCFSPVFSPYNYTGTRKSTYLLKISWKYKKKKKKKLKPYLRRKWNSTKVPVKRQIIINIIMMTLQNPSTKSQILIVMLENYRSFCILPEEFCRTFLCEICKAYFWKEKKIKENSMHGRWPGGLHKNEIRQEISNVASQIEINSMNS